MSSKTNILQSFNSMRFITWIMSRVLLVGTLDKDKLIKVWKSCKINSWPLSYPPPSYPLLPTGYITGSYSKLQSPITPTPYPTNIAWEISYNIGQEMPHWKICNWVPRESKRKYLPGSCPQSRRVQLNLYRSMFIYGRNRQNLMISNYWFKKHYEIHFSILVLSLIYVFCT